MQREKQVVESLLVGHKKNDHGQAQLSNGWSLPVKKKDLKTPESGS